MTKYTESFPVHDIPDYDYLFIREGDIVFMVNKYTGEIVENLSLAEYCKIWKNEWDTNTKFNSYYIGEYTVPKGDPNTARNMDELKSLCSDKSRRLRGDTGYLLDFMLKDSTNKTEAKLVLWVCQQVEVWNYAIIDVSQVQQVLGLKTAKQARATWKSVIDKGFIEVITDRFESDDGWKSLVRVHPFLYFKGRKSAWLHTCKMDYVASSE